MKKKLDALDLIIILICMAVLLAMCTTSHAAENYIEVGAGYAFNTPWGQVMDDEHYSWKGSNPTAFIALGHEFDNGVSVEYQHLSNWLTGFPLNTDGETGLDQVVVKYRWSF